VIKRLLIAGALLLLTVAAASAFWQSRDSNYNVAVSSGTVSYTGSGDVVSGWLMWGGLRAFTAAIATAGTQSLINVIASGTTPANVTCNILVASNGGLGQTASCSTGSFNGQAAAAFCATGSGSCLVDEVFDQSGNGLNFINSGTSEPSLVFSCIGSLPCMTFNGTSQHLNNSTAFTSQAQPYNITMVAERTGADTAFGSVFGFSGGTESGFSDVANSALAFAGTVVSVTAADSVFHAMNFTYNGASSAVNIDGTDTPSLNPGAAATGTTAEQIGSDGVNGNPFTGDAMEVGILPSAALTSTQRGNICHNQHLYWGTATSC
jgi:hypothetical protein